MQEDFFKSKSTIPSCKQRKCLSWSYWQYPEVDHLYLSLLGELIQQDRGKCDVRSKEKR